jgi:hypothetical protein
MEEKTIIPLVELPKEELSILLRSCKTTLEQLQLRDRMISQLEMEVQTQKRWLEGWKNAAR